MDVNSIGGHNHYTTIAKKAEKSAEFQNTRHMQQVNQSAASTASVVAQISYEAKKLYSENNFNMQTLDENSPFYKEVEELLNMSREERSEKLQSMLPKSEKPSLDPYIQTIFPEGSLGSFLTEKLEGKVDNPSYAARQINDMIKGGLEANPEATLEERAITREAGLKLAEYISQNYFDNPEEGEAFLNGVKMFAEKNIMSEKGYIVFENSDMQPLKPHNTLSNAPADYIGGTLNAYAKKYLGITSAEQLLENIGSVLNSYINDMKNNPQKLETLKKEIVNDFAANEKKVQDVIYKTKANFSEINTGANFMNDLSNVLDTLNQSDTAKWANDILKLFHEA